MIAALGSGVPVVVVGWMHKYPETMKLLGVERYSHSFENLSPQALNDSFADLWANRDQVRQTILTHLPAV